MLRSVTCSIACRTRSETRKGQAEGARSGGDNLPFVGTGHNGLS